MEFCDEQGFFHQDFESFRGSLSDGELRRFASYETASYRVKFVNSMLEERFGDLWKFRRQVDLGKNLAVAMDLKELGNKAFQYEKWIEACKCYNKAYLLLPTENDSEKSIVLANRSAALFHLNKYEQALQDIDISLELNYPDNMRYKIIERKARCYFGMKDLPLALKFYRETFAALEIANLSAEKREKWMKDTFKMIDDLELRLASVKKYLEPVKYTLTKRFIPFVDCALYFDSEEGKGRFVRSKTDLKPNHMLLKELPLASVVASEYSGTHCDHCCLRVEVLFCCPSCTDVLYCSKACQQAASSSYHRYECGFLPYLRNSGANVVAMLALRMVTQHSMEYFDRFKDDFDNSSSEDNDGLRENDYRRVLSMVTHSDGRDTVDNLQWSLMAALLNTVLQLSGFYTYKRLDAYIGTILLRNLQAVTYNSHEICELQRRRTLDAGKSACIGAGMYPTLILFNHSCDPGITRYFVGNAVYVRTVKNIPAGAEIAENYGQLFGRSARQERRDSLRTLYKFDCGCQACEEDWPTVGQMNPSSVRFKCAGTVGCTNGIVFTEDCSQDVIKCEKCGELTDVNSSFRSLKDTCLLQRYNEAVSLYEQGDYERSLAKYAALMTSMDEVLVKPYREYHLCQQGIRKCTLELGNTYCGP